MEFLKEYGLDEEDINSLYEKYDESLIEIISDNIYNVKNIINIFKKYGFYNIDEIIMYSLHIFVYSPDYIEKKLCLLKEKLGESYIDIISENLELLG